MPTETVKERILKAVKELPEESSYEDVMERLYFLYKIEKGMQQADAGKKISHDEAKTRMKKWLE
ncbi:MAG: hypothetical protein ACE5IR_15340 [bacterium]